MEIKDLLDNLSKYDEMEAPDGMNVSEAIGDIVDQRKGLNGNDWTRTEEGKFTFEILGVPVEYDLTKHVETDKDTKDIKTTEYEIKLTDGDKNKLVTQLQNKIEQDFIEQAKMYGLNVNYIGARLQIGIPSDANYIK